MKTKSYFASSAFEFLNTPTEIVLGRLATRVGTEHSGDEANQIRAWRVQIDLLKASLSKLNIDGWGILLEMPLLRLGRRIDAIILVEDQIACIEFKIGSKNYGSADVSQATTRYAYVTFTLPVMAGKWSRSSVRIKHPTILKSLGSTSLTMLRAVFVLTATVCLSHWALSRNSPKATKCLGPIMTPLRTTPLQISFRQHGVFMPVTPFVR